MEYKLYTLVDITSTGQYRHEAGKESLRWKEQNFSSVVQTLGMRANIAYTQKPIATSVKGTVVGFDIEDVVKVWRFDFSTERDFLYQKDDDSVGYLKDDFNGVPYISGVCYRRQKSKRCFSSKIINTVSKINTLIGSLTGN
jgi:hypothetical protein